MNCTPAQRIFGRRTSYQPQVYCSNLRLQTQQPQRSPTQTEGEANPFLQQDLRGLQPLQKGETFRVVWQPGDRGQKQFKGEVEEQADVRTEDGTILCRNRKHLRSSRELFHSTLTEIPSLCQPAIPGKFPSAASIVNNSRSRLDQPKQATKLPFAAQSKDQPSYESLEIPTIQDLSRIKRSRRLFNPPSCLKDYAQLNVLVVIRMCM